MFLTICLSFLCWQRKRIIQIIFWNIDHCIDFSILWIHQDHGYLFCPLLFLHLLTCLYRIILQIHVKRNVKITSGNWFFPLLICSIDFYAASICQCPDPSRLSFQISVIKNFQSNDPLVISSCESKNFRCQVPIWIYSFVVFIHLDPVKFILTDTVCDVFFYVTFNFFPY